MGGKSCFNCKWFLKALPGGFITPPEPAVCAKVGNEQCSTLTTFPFLAGCKHWDSKLPPPPEPVTYRCVVIFGSVKRESDRVVYRCPFLARGLMFVDLAAAQGFIDIWYGEGCKPLEEEEEG